MSKKFGILIFFIVIQLTLVTAQNLSELPILSKKTVEEQVVFEACKNINTKKVEFSPAWYKDGIVYVGEEKGNKNDRTYNPETGNAVFKYFQKCKPAKQ